MKNTMHKKGLNLWKSEVKGVLLERIYNSHYGNGVPAMLSSWKINIAENPIAVKGL